MQGNPECTAVRVKLLVDMGLFRQWKLTTVLLVFLADSALLVLPAQESLPVRLHEAAEAFQQGSNQKAADIAAEWLQENDTQDLNALWIHALSLENLEKYAPAINSYRKIVQQLPNEPRSYLSLGAATFKNAEFEPSITAFNQAAELDPSLKAQLWQLGITQYYARQFQDGADLFETHRKVNPNDVENSVWHFLCIAAVQGPEVALRNLIPTAHDSRVPMMDIYDLFRGVGSVGQVIQAAVAASSPVQKNRQLFYAHLYLGLYFEAWGDAQQSTVHIAESVKLKDSSNYMWHVARIHQAERSKPN